jgi:predicted PurR-regulated permease PerM
MTLLSGFKNLLVTSKPYDEDELAHIAPVAAPTVEAVLNTESSPPEPEPLLETTRHLLQVATAILVLLALYTFYISSPVLIPLTLAVLITMALSPVISVFDGLHFPRPLSAAIVMAILVGALGVGAYGLSGPAREWLQKLPENGAKINSMLRSIKQPFAQMQKATEELASTTVGGRANAPQRVQMAAPGLTERLVGGGAQVAATTSVIFVLVYFLLSSGDTFLRKLVSVIPTLRDKKRTVEIIRSIESDISFYLVMMLLTNIGLGLGVAGITAFLGIPDPLLWGTLAAVLSFAPYVGEMAIAVMLLVVSMVTFDTLGTSLIAPISYLLLMGSVHLIVPFIVRRRLLLNPVAIFVGIIFLGWIWGIPGALLAVPLLASFKTICERIGPLNPIAAFLTP